MMAFFDYGLAGVSCEDIPSLWVTILIMMLICK